MYGDGMADCGALQALGRLIGETVIAEMRSSSVYISQKESPLGPRRHIAAVKRRMLELPEAQWECSFVDKKYYLTPKGLREEMLRHAMGKAPKLAKVVPSPASDRKLDAGQQLLADLRRLRGA
jgi:hypothetical protein